jgi:hypothetical protein
MLTASPMYVNIGVADRDGKVWCSAVPFSSTVDVSDRSYFKRAMETRRFAVGTYQIGRITLAPSLNFAHPIVGQGGQIEAVAFAAQSLNWFTVALARMDFPAGAILVVTDSDGTVLARIPDAENFAGKPVPDSELRAALMKPRVGGVFEANDAAGMRRLWAATSVADFGLHVAIGVPRAAAFADIDRRLRNNLVVLGCAPIPTPSASYNHFTAILRDGNSSCAFCNAARTRSRDSLTSVSGRPTSLNAGSPPAT